MPWAYESWIYARIVAATNGFSLVTNERQLASYAGLDVVQRQSEQVSGATRVSCRGNARLRTALYLPAVSSLRYNPQQRLFYARLRTRHANGRSGVIAVMRKLLLLCYALWKTDRAYDPAYHPAHAGPSPTGAAPEPAAAPASSPGPSGHSPGSPSGRAKRTGPTLSAAALGEHQKVWGSRGQPPAGLTWEPIFVGERHAATPCLPFCRRR